MKRISKTEYYLNIAEAVSKRSTCIRRHYGCVIVRNDEIIATGYNGSPRGETNCCDVYEICPRHSQEHNTGNYGDCPAVHAEQNAMLSAPRHMLAYSTVYLAGFEGDGTPIEECKPCPICERMLKNAVVKKIVTRHGEIVYNPVLTHDQWIATQEASRNHQKEAEEQERRVRHV